MNIHELVGSGRKITLFTLPFFLLGLFVQVWYSHLLLVNMEPGILRILSLVLFSAGIVIWLWSVILILTKVPRQELITTGPYAIMKHPLYTGIALLVLPGLGLWFGSWLGVLVGLAMYVGTRLFATEEEKHLAVKFGPAWEEYRHRVLLPWL